MSQLCADAALLCSIHKKNVCCSDPGPGRDVLFFALVYISGHCVVPDGVLGTVGDHTNSLTDI